MPTTAFTPSTPKASIQAVLQAYHLNPGDTIEVDAGTYELTTNIILDASESGITIDGYNDPAYPNLQTVLDRGNTSSGSDVLQMAGATGVTLDNLSITGGQYGIYAGSGAGSTGLTVSNCDVYGDTYGICADSGAGSSGLTVSQCDIYGNADNGIELDSSNDDTADYRQPGPRQWLLWHLGR